MASLSFLFRRRGDLLTCPAALEGGSPLWGRANEQQILWRRLQQRSYTAAFVRGVADLALDWAEHWEEINCRSGGRAGCRGRDRGC
jgi:hypothetical protein